MRFDNLWWLLTYFIWPKFWREVWSGTKIEEGLGFAIWLTSFVTLVTMLYIGLIATLIWSLPILTAPITVLYLNAFWWRAKK